MSVIITGMDMPKGCTKCSYLDKEYNSDDTPISICRLLNYSEIDGFSTGERYFDCPLKSVKGLIEQIEQAKQYKGLTGNPTIDKHNIGLDRYFDLGLDKAIKIIKEYCEVEE